MAEGDVSQLAGIHAVMNLREYMRSIETKSILQVRKLVKYYPSTNGKGRESLLVLDDISLDVGEGEFVTLIGPSGCGKTTLLNIVAGLEGYESGDVIVTGHRISSSGPDIVMIFQEDALFPWLNVKENVEFGLKQLGITKEERQKTAEQYIEMVGLTAFANSFVHQLSGGMKQRVAIARGLALNPRILLMDEPFGALDATNREILQKHVQEIHAKTKKTIIFVTHDVREAVCLGDRVVLFTRAPARIKRQFVIDRPRPRSSEDLALRGLTNAVLRDLKEEGGLAEYET
ncbi:MAG: ABC transporter ATP-binding protein [Nitrososphaerales archaeon]|jgi:NitT/TauT family transport system ATP-binding protein